jgi:hypothetical protein
MAPTGRSVVDIGMEILRAEGAIPMEAPAAETAEPKKPTETELMGALADQLERMADRLSLAEAVAEMQTMLKTLTNQVALLSDLVAKPRVKVPVRDEAGRITEVREVIERDPYADL